MVVNFLVANCPFQSLGLDTEEGGRTDKVVGIVLLEIILVSGGN